MLQIIKNGVLQELTVELAWWGRGRQRSAMTLQDDALGAIHDRGQSQEQ